MHVKVRDARKLLNRHRHPFRPDRAVGADIGQHRLERSTAEVGQAARGQANALHQRSRGLRHAVHVNLLRRLRQRRAFLAHQPERSQRQPAPLDRQKQILQEPLLRFAELAFHNQQVGRNELVERVHRPQQQVFDHIPGPVARIRNDRDFHRTDPSFP